jgi:RIO-like serine/threonine protein kinase
MIPEGWVQIDTIGKKFMPVLRGQFNVIAVYKESSVEIVDRLIAIQKYGYTPEVYWTDGEGNYIMEYINGLAWKLYLDKVDITEELAEWYILENWNIRQEIGPHGDFVWYNVMITDDGWLRWIDIGKYMADGMANPHQFVSQIQYHIKYILSEDRIYNVIGVER